MFSGDTHRIVYIAGLAMVLCSLPASTIGVSVGMIVMGINFIISGQWQAKVKLLKQKPLLLLFIAMFFPMLLSGLLSENHRLGFEIIRLWLPVLLIPPIVATSEELSPKEFRLIASLFIASTFVVTLVGTYSFFTQEYTDARYVSPFISHIRLALMVNLAIALLGYFFTEYRFLKPLPRIMPVLLILWFIFFLVILKSFTGLLMLLILISLIAIKSYAKLNTVLRFVTLTGLAAILFISLSYVLHFYDGMHAIRQTHENKPKLTTPNGNRYRNDTLSLEVENGFLVNINICEEELRNEWRKRSALPYDGTDSKGQPLRHTLIRYLTSAGLTKDSLGVSRLDANDIDLIERGFTNTLFKGRLIGFKSRFYEFFYEIDRYRQTGKFTGGSVLRRVIYAKAAWYVIKGNPIFGVGYGDLPKAMNQFYEESNVDLPPYYRFMPHNQYLTVWASAGIIGLIVFIMGLTLPFVYSPNFRALPVKFFWLMVIVSMFFEDTMLTHIGISFVVVFSALFIFGYTFKPKSTLLNETR